MKVVCKKDWYSPDTQDLRNGRIDFPIIQVWDDTN